MFLDRCHTEVSCTLGLWPCLSFVSRPLPPICTRSPTQPLGSHPPLMIPKALPQHADKITFQWGYKSSRWRSLVRKALERATGQSEGSPGMARSPRLTPGWATNSLRDLSESGESTTPNAHTSRIFPDTHYLPWTPPTYTLISERRWERWYPFVILPSPTQEGREKWAGEESRMPGPTSPFAFGHP